MSRISPFIRGLAILAVIALAIVVLNQETALATAGALVSVAFFLAIAVAVYMFWRDFGRREISIWPTRVQRIFYAAVGAVRRRPWLVFRVPPERPGPARLLRRRRGLHLCGDPHVARPAQVQLANLSIRALDDGEAPVGD